MNNYSADFYNVYCEMPAWLTEALTSDDSHVAQALETLSISLLTESTDGDLSHGILSENRIARDEQNVKRELEWSKTKLACSFSY